MTRRSRGSGKHTKARRRKAAMPKQNATLHRHCAVAAPLLLAKELSSRAFAVPIADIQAGFGYYCWWARVPKFVEHHP